MKPFPSAAPRTPSAATLPMDNRSGPGRNPRAVEKPGPWKPWKTKRRFSTVPTAPWKSLKTGIPTFPPLRLRFPSCEPKNENFRRQADEDPPAEMGNRTVHVGIKLAYFHSYG